MFQKKGHKAEEGFPNCKIAIPSNQEANDFIIEKLLDLGLQLNIPIPESEDPEFLYIVKNKIGFNSNFTTFNEAPYREMNISELSLYERVPLSMTLSEVSEMLGHDIKIIK